MTGEVGLEAGAAWTRLRTLTPARIGIPRSGISQSTGPLLDFRAAHAAARDAVWHSLEPSSLAAALAKLNQNVAPVASRANGRREYLMRPDLGRHLDDESIATLSNLSGHSDLVIVVADGLSAIATERHAGALLAHLLPALTSSWRLAPLVVATGARVALGDAAATALGAGCVLTLIGERPGLSSPDSLGAYLTWRPGASLTDADRNCISNIRPAGLSYAEAARQILYMLNAMRAANYSGVALKNRSDDGLLPANAEQMNEPALAPVRSV